jgi:hypothetical protein
VYFAVITGKGLVHLKGAARVTLPGKAAIDLPANALTNVESAETVPAGGPVAAPAAKIHFTWMWALVGGAIAFLLVAVWAIRIRYRRRNEAKDELHG